MRRTGWKGPSQWTTTIVDIRIDSTLLRRNKFDSKFIALNGDNSCQKLIEWTCSSLVGVCLEVTKREGGSRFDDDYDHSTRMNENCDLWGELYPMNEWLNDEDWIEPELINHITEININILSRYDSNELCSIGWRGNSLSNNQLSAGKYDSAIIEGNA